MANRRSSVWVALISIRFIGIPYRSGLENFLEHSTAQIGLTMPEADVMRTWGIAGELLTCSAGLLKKERSSEKSGRGRVDGMSWGQPVICYK
jgi:hypothetical protein